MVIEDIKVGLLNNNFKDWKDSLAMNINDLSKN